MRRVRSFLQVFLLWTLVGVVSKVVFLSVYFPLLRDASATHLLGVLWNGLRLDIAIAGYLTLIPGLLITTTLWWRTRLQRWLWKGYFAVTGLLAALAYVANVGLYGYWGFPLDNTSLLYLKTSPADAFASMTWWQLVVAPLCVLAVAVVIYRAGVRCYPSDRKVRRIWVGALSTVGLLLLDAFLILPIRGGVGTGTNHTGSVYFSDDIRLNHAAVNPIFSFVEAVVHQEEIGTKYRYMSDGEATALLSELTYTKLQKGASFSTRRPNVVLIVLESFSDTIMHVRDVAPNLQRLTAEGLYFPRFYANSFRTDRALVSIHSGLPAQPTMSVMDMPRKSTSLPSIAGALAKNGYHTTFYYGGDINYSNMRSYFMGTGFQRIVSDSDFPSRLRTGKWGVPDGPVYERMLTDIKEGEADEPFFVSIMTASSHEPFDVPDYHKIKDNEVLNAFSYADDCLGRFVKALKQLPCWENTLVAIVPDHLGAYPDNADNYQPWRYHTPFIIIGGAVPSGVQCRAIGSQIDIAATLLGLLGIDHADFSYSKDLLDAKAPHFAFFTFPEAMGMVTDTCTVVYDMTSERVHLTEGAGADSLLLKSKAYLQKLYDDIDGR